MSAAKNRRIKATKPLEAWPGGVPQYASEMELRDAQAREWTGQFITFDHQGQRVAGKCVNCRAIPRMEPDEIPDFRLTVASIKDPARQVRIRMLDTRAHCYPTMEAAQGDALLRAGKEGAQ